MELPQTNSVRHVFGVVNVVNVKFVVNVINVLIVSVLKRLGVLIVDVGMIAV